MKKPSTLFFDVNETLLDLSFLKEKITTALDDRRELVSLWFSTSLHYSLVANTIEAYKDFGEIGVAALQMVAAGNDITLTKQQAEAAVIKPFKKLKPYSEVRTSLLALREQGFRLVALTNSSQKGLEEKLEFAGIADCFDTLLSCEPVQKFKPAPEVYNWAMTNMGVLPENAMMIAAHGWDIAGAQNAGMQTVFINRPGKQQYPLVPEADYVVDDLSQLASVLK